MPSYRCWQTDRQTDDRPTTRHGNRSTSGPKNGFILEPDPSCSLYWYYMQKKKICNIKIIIYSVWLWIVIVINKIWPVSSPPVLSSKFLAPPPWVSGGGGTKIKDPVVDSTWPGFHPALGVFRRDAPALSLVRSPNNGKVGNPVLCLHSQCFGSYFDVIFLAPLCHLAAELFKCRLVRRRWRRRQL